MHSRCGARVAASHCAVDHVKATLSLIQPQLEIGTAISREILRPPLDVKDAVGGSTTYRGESVPGKPTVDQVRGRPSTGRSCSCGPAHGRQTLVKAASRRRELRIAVGRHIDAGEALVIQGVTGKAAERWLPYHPRDCRCPWCLALSYRRHLNYADLAR